MTTWSTFLLADPRTQGWAQKTHVHRGDVILVHEQHDVAFTVERNLGLAEAPRQRGNSVPANLWRFRDTEGRTWTTLGSYLLYWPQPYCEVHESWRPCSHNGGVQVLGRWTWPLPLPGLQVAHVTRCRQAEHHGDGDQGERGQPPGVNAHDGD